MSRNMKKWIADYIDSPKKKAMPILSFPGAVMLEVTVEELVRSSHLQALCMQEIAERFDTGASFSLMDLSVEAEAFGSRVVYSKEEVPTVVGELVRDGEDVRKLAVPAIGSGRTGECIKGIEEAGRLITDRPVLAGMIGPFSLAGRLANMTKIMYLCFDEPEMVEELLEKSTKFLIAYARAFKDAGANGICLAEPAAGLLSPQLFETFSLPYVKRIREAVEDENFIVLYHNCGNIRPLLESIEKIGAKAYSVGNSIDMELALEKLPSDALVIGNVAPGEVIRNADPQKVYEQTTELLARCGGHKNYVVASGCDIPPLSPVENIEAMFRAVNDFYSR